MRALSLRVAAGLVIIVLLGGGFGGMPAGALSGPPRGASGACTGAWELVDSPNPSDGFPFNVFRDVAALAPDDVWAVGNYTDGGNSKALLAHWTGAGWELHDPGLDLASSIAAVAFASPTDGWAVGDTHIGFSSTALALHWDGTEWSQVEIPNPEGVILLGVEVISPDDAWAVGFSSTAGTVTEHWDGSAWTLVPSPDPAEDSTLWGVAGSSAADVWAVGGGLADFPSERRLIEHWDGQSWSVAFHDPNRHARLYGVDATSTSDAWTVGWDGLRNTELVMRWDGSSWRVIRSPLPGSGSILKDVDALSSNYAWAVGSFTDAETGDLLPLVEHWNGQRWRRVPAEPSPDGAALHAVSASSRADAWAVGGEYGFDGGFTVVERRCLPGGR
jgi:hypothetical protein